MLLWLRGQETGRSGNFLNTLPRQRSETAESVQRNRLPNDRTEVKALTGLRGIAALMVAIYHINPELSTNATFAIGNIVDRGYLWVDLFFVLSGFVLALNYGHRFAEGWSLGEWRDFLFRRVARIFPLYFVATVAGAVILVCRDSTFATELFTPTDHDPLTPGVANLLMVQSWGMGKSIDGTAWSLSAEWALYLAFPILAELALFGRASTAVLLVMISAAAAVLTVCSTGLDGEVHRGPLDAYDGATWEPLLRCLAGFLIGLLSYRFVTSKRASQWVSGDVACAASLSLLFICLATRFYDLLILPLFPLVVVTLYANRGRVGRFLGGKYFNKLGLVSYSVYLVHPYLVLAKPTLLAALHRFLPVSASALSGSILVYAALLLISAIAYRYIEVPGRRFVTQLSRRSA